MGGVKINEDFVSSSVAKEQVRAILAKMVGPRTNDEGKRMKPDLIFAIDVIRRTFSPRILKGQKRADYDRAIETLFDVRDELCQMDTTIELLWHVDDEAEE
jgi:hypothetical protein